MSTLATKVSVIIPHYSDLAALDVCLQSLERQTLDRSRFEIIVADNASPEGPEAVGRVVANRAKLVIVTEKGAGPARNGGVAAASGEVLAFIDSDCVAEPAWLEEGLSALRDWDFVGGRVRVLVQDARRVTPTEAFERVFAFDFKTYIQKKGFTGSGNMFCPKSIFEAVGGFRTGVSEDVEWSHRARAAGNRLGYAPKAVVGHPARRNWVEIEKKWRRMNIEGFGLACTKRGGRWLWLLRTAALPASAIVHSPKVLFSSELETSGQRVAALGMLFRIRLWRFFDGLRLLAGAKGA